MTPRKTDLLAAVLFVTVAAIAIAADPPAPCTNDGKNWATVTENCTGDPIRTCAAAMGKNNYAAACPSFVVEKQYSNNFYCYSSTPIGGPQSTNCVRPKNPDGSDMTASCHDRRDCEAQNLGSETFPDWVCVPFPTNYTTTKKLWTNAPCTPAPG